MRSYAAFTNKIRAAGGDLVAICSEPHSLASMAKTEWDLDYETVGDPHHEILQTCRDRQWMDVFVNTNNSAIEGSRSWVSHPNGMFQPGVLAMTKEGRILYRWRSRPNRNNIGGAGRRPTPEYVWEQICNGLQSSSQDNATFDESPEYDMKEVPLAFFVVLLLAHGWFLSPKVFPTGVGDEKERHPFKMGPRIALFLLLIVAAFLLLPSLWVIGALAVWAAYIAPKIAQLYREFQNATEEEEPGWGKGMPD